MDFIEVKIFTSTKGIDIIGELLTGLNINGFTIEDSADFEEFLKSTEIHWDYVDEELMRLRNCETTITAYLADNEQGKQILSEISNSLYNLKKNDQNHEYGRLEIEIGSVCEEDWANNWKQYFKPLYIGDKFIIKPTWENCDNPDGRKILEIDPGSCFGTGQHYTTLLCLEALETIAKDGMWVLDLGCGSGILSIASVLLGAKAVTGIDIDQNSVKVSIDNAAQNGIGRDVFNAYCGNILTDKKLLKALSQHSFDIVVANIVADVIIAMSGLFDAMLKPDGTLILSGIINIRRDEVVKEIKTQGFEIIKEYCKNDWICLICKKK